MKPTLTEQQARDRVEQYIQGAVSALPDTARRQFFNQNRSECTDPTDNGPLGRFEISATYEILGLDAARFPEHFNAVVQWWTSHDFTVLTDFRPKDQYVFVRNNTDAFDMSIEANDLGKLYIGATSPCIWPNGTPPANALEADSEEPQPAAAVREEQQPRHRSADLDARLLTTKTSPRPTGPTRTSTKLV